MATSNPTAIRAAIYARVSTNNGQNPQMQLDEAAKDRRPQLGAMLAVCRRRG